MGKKVWEMDRLMRSEEGKLLAMPTDYSIRTAFGKGTKKQVKAKRITIDFRNLPKTAENIHVIFPKYGKGKRPHKSQRSWSREQVIKYFEPW